ncbi:MAG: polyamine aminopropyltransferase [Desulfobacterales bacterium]|nr:polyamine aminopropyltransferase [Desulfobacterales bacterium]MCP4159418.1 polyamine aminopropyltransferase [Deltaproteobacteria bacterium]
MENSIPKRASFFLVPAMALVAASGMIYELLIATISGYILGDNVTHFSIIVGVFLCAMGIGALLSRHIHKNLMRFFFRVEILLAIVGLLSSTVLLYVGFVIGVEYIYVICMLSFTCLIGCLVGLEIPILSRYLEDFGGSRISISNILAADYIGSLIGSVCYPFLLLPFLGLVSTSAVAGLINIIVAVCCGYYFRKEIKSIKLYSFFCIVITGLLITLFFISGKLFNYFEYNAYRDKIVHSEQSKYQRIVMTKGKLNKKGLKAGYLPRRWKEDFRLFLEGHLQFSSIDEYRYHEALVIPALSMIENPETVLILGGGDGLAAKQVFKFKSIKKLTLVDLDKKVVDLAKNKKDFIKINGNSLSDKRINIIIGDAFSFIRKNKEKYDLIISDLPDPHTPALSRFYSVEFYLRIQKSLSKKGIFVSQSTSPYFARRAYWAIGKSLETAGYSVLSYHANVMAFGDWGFHMAKRTPFGGKPIKLSVDTKYLTDQQIPSMFIFGKDVEKVAVESNTLDNMKLFTYYNADDWDEY